MAAIRFVNDILAFILELAMLAALGVSGYALGKGMVVKIILAVLMPAIAIVLWGYFAAPKSAHRLEYPGRILFETVIFVTAAAVLYRAGYHKAALWLGGVAVVNEVVALVLRR